MPNVTARKQLKYKGYTIEYYQEVFKAWTGLVVEFRGTGDEIRRSGTSPALVIARVKHSINKLLSESNPLAEVNYRGYVLVYDYDCADGASYFICTADRSALATVNADNTGKALEKAKGVIDGILGRIEAQVKDVDVFQKWLTN